jgi:hypothetical protein
LRRSAKRLDDVGILQVNFIASFIDYINRVADGLGVGRGPAVSTRGGQKMLDMYTPNV